MQSLGARLPEAVEASAELSELLVEDCLLLLEALEDVGEVLLLLVVKSRRDVVVYLLLLGWQLRCCDELERRVR